MTDSKHFIEKAAEWSVLECSRDSQVFKIANPDKMCIEQQTFDRSFSWSEVKAVVLAMKGWDSTGTPLQWFKDYWSKDGSAKEVSPSWKYFLNGMRTALFMMRPGEEGYFKLMPLSQECSFIINYPVSPEPVFLQIDLKEVKMKAKVLGPGVYDISKQEESIARLKEATDKEYNRNRNHQLGVQEYERIGNKLAGLLVQVKKAEDFTRESKLIQQLMIAKNNLALMHYKLKNYETAIRLLDEVLEKQPHNLKALQRKAHSLEALNSLDEALRIFRNAGDPIGLQRIRDKITDRNISLMRQLKMNPLVETQECT